jgi:hypothetical protein
MILLALAPDDIFVVLIAAEELTDHDLDSDEPEVDEELDDAVPEDESLHEDTLEPDNFPTSSFEPYEVRRQRPIVVVLYNSDRVVGRQAGLREATTIYEFPLAMYLTQLVAVFDSVDPGRIGPIAPLQDYQYFIAEDLNGVIVHMGGQSVALDAVAQGRVPSFDAHEDRFRELYNRYQGDSAPYNLYSDGTKLRDFLQVYDRDEARSVQGVAYRPIPELPEAGVLEVHHGGYASGFHYIPELGLYRWHRSGVPATDADGEAVVTQAIVIAHVEAVSVMGDSEDRLKLAIDEGGEATLFLGGKVIAGRWQREDGFQFVAQGEQPLDLTPFKTWVKFVPPWARVTLP